MRVLVVDRIENGYVICEGEEQRMFALVKDEAPAGVKEGDCIVIDDEGNLSVDEELTKQRREAAIKKRK